VKKQPHYWPLHLIALASDANDQQDIKGQRSVTDSVTPSNANSSSSRTTPMRSLVAKTNLVAAALGQNLHLETISKLVSMFQRYIFSLILFFYHYGLKRNDIVFR